MDFASKKVDFPFRFLNGLRSYYFLNLFLTFPFRIIIVSLPKADYNQELDNKDINLNTPFRNKFCMLLAGPGPRMIGRLAVTALCLTLTLVSGDDVSHNRNKSKI